MGSVRGRYAGHKTCTWDSDGEPEGENLLEDVGVQRDILRWILKKQERVWIEMAHHRVKLHKHTLFRLTQHVITFFYATRSDRK
jgi:hypothetical protein